jgi:hypothetical protein
MTTQEITMGLLDKAREQAAAQQERSRENAAAQQAVTMAAADAARAVTSACPGNHFKTEVNRGSIRMQTWESHLNDMYRSGYRLSHVFEQDGNTVQVFEHSFH